MSTLEKAPTSTSPNAEELTDTLRAADYTEDSIARLLGIRDVPNIRPQDIPSYLRRCQQDNSARALLTCFWLLHQYARKSQLEKMLGAKIVEGLQQNQMIAEVQPGVMSATVDLYPCMGNYVFTDPLLARSYEQGHVYQLGTDSYVLARVTPRRRGKRALDLCTGSGIHAILAAHHHEESYGIDLNPRALSFSEANAALNGVSSKTHFLQGDLYEPVKGKTFDLITANPPFVPTPDADMLIHRTGGESGEEISERLVAGLPEFLEPGGTFSMVLDWPLMRASTYLQRLRKWLGHTKGWGIAVLNMGVVPRELYIKQHADDTDPNFFQMYERYLQSYERLGITEIAFGNVFIQRLDPAHPGYAIERMMISPNTVMCREVDAWLETLAQTRAQNWQPTGKPRRDAQKVKDTWLNEKKTQGVIDYFDSNWSMPLQTDGPTIELLRACNGRNTAEKLAERYGKERLAFLAENLAVKT